MPLKIQKLATACAALAACVSLSGCSSYDMHLPSLRLASINPFHHSSDTPQMPSEPEPPVPGTPVVQPDTPPLYCRAGRGSAHFKDSWYDYRDTTFTLYDGVPAPITLTAVHSARIMTLQALFDKKGQRLLFCPTPDTAHGQVTCDSIYALQADLYAGIKRTFDVPAVERDGDITCAYTLDHLRSFKLPPE